MDTLNEPLLLTLGWLSGLLATMILDWNRELRQRREAGKLIRVELEFTKSLLVLAAHTIDLHLGRVARNSIQWSIDNLPLNINHADIIDARKSLEALFSMSDEELTKFLTSSQRTDTHSPVLMSYETPLIDTRVAAISVYKTEQQIQLLQIKTAMRSLAQLATRQQQLLDKTYSELPQTTQVNIHENIQACLKNYSWQAKLIVELMDRVLKAS